MPRIHLFAVTLVTLAAAASAHEGVTNPAVLARMDAMKAVAGQMKVLGTMAKGDAAFDASLAQQAGTAVLRHATEVPALFQSQQTDPRSEAAPAIWTDWDDLVAQSRRFETAAAMAAAISTPEDLSAAMRALGASCKSCHEAYRIEK